MNKIKLFVKSINKMYTHYIFIRIKREKGRPRMCYIRQVIKDARVNLYKQLKDKVQDRESRREHLL